MLTEHLTCNNTLRITPYFINCRYVSYFLAWITLLFIGGCDQAEKRFPTHAPPMGHSSQVVPVRILSTPSGFQLTRGGKPFHIRGGAGLQFYGQLKAAGGNSVRLWSTDYAGPLLDSAQQHGLTVMLGLWFPSERQGFDYHNRIDRIEQLQRLRQQVLRYRHHPALLMWNIGNELDQLDGDPSIYKAVEEVAQMIHELDPNHPVTTSMLPYLSMVDALRRFAPSIDVLSVNTYAGLGDLPNLVRDKGWNGPYIITEFGSKGYWESPHTPWRAPIEQTSSIKAEFVLRRYKRAVVSDSTRCLGAYAFYWGNKFEVTPTWFSLFEANGEKTALVDALHHVWKGQYPPNRAPNLTGLQLGGMRTNNLYLRPGTEYRAIATAFDLENDSLTAHWEIRPEADSIPIGSDPNLQSIPRVIEHTVMEASGLNATLRTPLQTGAYRLYLRIYDGQGGVATGNIPFYCTLGPIIDERRLSLLR